MSSFSKYAIRILYFVLLYSVLKPLCPENRVKNWLNTLSGIGLIILLLSSAVDLELPEFTGIKEDYLKQAESTSEIGEDYARKQRQKSIKETLEAYILDKAHALGLQLTVCVDLNYEGYPVSVAYKGNAAPDDREKIENIVWEEVGITKEDQHWDGLQMQKYSAIP